MFDEISRKRSTTVTFLLLFFFFFIGVYVFVFYMFDEISIREFGFKIKTHDQFNYLFRLNLFHK
jgi:hypothetical protein